MKRTLMSVTLAIALLAPTTTWSASRGATNSIEGATSNEVLYRNSDDSWVPFEQLTPTEQEDFFAKEEEAFARKEETQALFDRVNTLVIEGNEVEEIWDSFSDTERELSHFVFEPATIELEHNEEPSQAVKEAGNGPVSNTCKYKIECVEYRNVYGWLLWRYCQDVNWCYDGRKITYEFDKITGSAYYGWTYEPRTESESGGVGYSEYRHYSQGAFCYQPMGACWLSYYPWIEQTCKADGGYIAKWGA